MRCLEALFHPDKRGGPIVVRVGRVCCEGSRAWVEAAVEGAPPGLDREALVAKLQFLVTGCGARPFEGLRALRSEFWSFVEAER